MKIEKILSEKIAEALKALFSYELSAAEISFQKTRKEFEGDLTLVVFPFTKAAKLSPEETANKIGTYVQENTEEVTGFDVVKGFLNLVIADCFWLNYLKNISSDKALGFMPTADVKNIMVEYSSPNTNKPLHLGHVRNNLLGYSVAEILKANGHTVYKTNLVNDRGIHICKSMLAWKKWGNGETPESTGMKGDHLVGKYYVIFDKNYKAEINELTGQGMPKEEAEKQAALIKEDRSC